jgi:DUF1680 family protein
VFSEPDREDKRLGQKITDEQSVSVNRLADRVGDEIAAGSPPRMQIVQDRAGRIGAAVLESDVMNRFRYVLLFCCVATASSQVRPALESVPRATFELGGFVGERLRANLEGWELRAPEANPALIEMFYDRERKPDRRLLPWSGEFVGKYLCSSILSYRLLHDPRQKDLIQSVARAFMASQGTDGYLGPFDRKNRLTGNNWDVWGHYWAIRALLLYHEEFGAPEALRSAVRAADLLVDTFLDKNIHLTNDGSFGQMNYAVIHAFTSLYRVTGNPRYLAMANWIVKEWDLPGAGLYMRMALAGNEMFEFAGNRWESLHDFLGMGDMYLLTGEARYHDAFTRIWYSILKGDRHNTGGFTSGERTTGNPYDPRAIETCCTVAWIDLSIDMLKLTGDSLVADEIELATLNGAIGGQSPSGRWWTYNTPMDGVKEASAHSINFQCRPGSPELNCCSVNGPRSLGLIAEWAAMRSAEGVVLNYFGPSKFVVPTPAGQRVELQQKTAYPAAGDVSIAVSVPKPEKFTLALRVPSWSASTSVAVNREAVRGVAAGAYLKLDREWKAGDTVEVRLDFSPHYWAGERELDGRTSIYRGPLLLAFDPAHNSMDVGDIPELDAAALKLEPVTAKRLRSWVLLLATGIDGRPVALCDFATAGMHGNSYRSWLVVRNVRPRPFAPRSPVWNNR